MTREERFEIFLKKSREKYGNKYDYSKVEYVNQNTEICIICPHHGEFYITPFQHLGGHGCTLCAKNGKWSTEKFIQKAIETHGDKYDYSKVEYKSAHEKVCIICHQHGEFWQSATAHIRGQGCPHCQVKHGSSKHVLLNEWNEERTKWFIEGFKEKHGNKYDYSLVRLNTGSDLVCIICPEHGKFWQQANSHKRKCGCPKCSTNLIGNSSKINYETFLERARATHGDTYEYVEESYIGYRKHMTIICPIHGEFSQTPIAHVYGSKCPHCGKESMLNKLTLPQEEFINRALNAHGNKYDYSKVNYVNLTTKVCIICPIHGEFLQSPDVHLQGKGCPKCQSSKLEMELIKTFEENNIKYEYQSKPKFITKENKFWSVDFYLPQYHVIVECQGQQHFTPVDFSGHNWEKAVKKCDELKKRDKRKVELCNQNGIEIVYFTNVDIDESQDYLGHLFTSTESLLSYILTKAR